MANKFKKVRCVCEKCNKPFSSMTEMEHPLCATCFEQQKFENLGIKKVRHAVRTENDIKKAEMEDLQKVEDALTRKRIIEAQNKRKEAKENVTPKSQTV